MPPNSPAELGTGSHRCTRSASVPSGKGPPVPQSLPTQTKAGPLSVSSLFSPPGLAGRLRGAMRLKVVPRSSNRRLRVGCVDSAFVLLLDNRGNVARARGPDQCALTVCPQPPNVKRMPDNSTAPPFTSLPSRFSRHRFLPSPLHVLRRCPPHRLPLLVPSYSPATAICISCAIRGLRTLCVTTGGGGVLSACRLLQ